MTFVTTGLAIAGLAAVAIPILIHLLARQRRKPIEWAAMRFLIEAFRKHKRRLHLEQFILLAVRCLIVALLGMALARPVLEAAGLIKPGGARTTYLIIDNGLASAIRDDQDRTALDRHIEQAIEVVKTLAPGDTVGLVTAARPAQALLAPPSSDHGGVIDVLESLIASQAPTDFDGAFTFVRSAVDESRQSQRPALVYLFSEFRSGSAQIDSPLPPTQAESHDQVKLLASTPAVDPAGNVQVVAIEPVRSLLLPGADDGSRQVSVRLKRSGGQLVGDLTRVRLEGQGLAPLEPQVIHWQPGQSEADAEFIISFSGSSADRQISLTATIDDDALNADNQRYRVIDLRSAIRVLLVDRRTFGFERTLDRLTAGQWIRRALEPQESGPIQIVEVEPAALDVADMRTADVAVVPRPDLLSDAGWAILSQFVNARGLLIIMPPAEVNVHQWTERLSQDLHLPWRVAMEVVEHPEGRTLAQEQPLTEILRLISSELPDLARPVIAHRTLPLERDSSTQGQAWSSGTLLAFADGSPMLIAGAPQPPADESAAAEAQQDEQERNPRSQVSPGGLAIYLAVAPELSWTNLPTQPLMVPLLQELVRQGLSVIRAAQRFAVGEQTKVAHGSAARDVIGPQDQKIPLDAYGRVQKPFKKAGVYSVQDQAGQAIGRFAVNIDPAAGNTDVQSAAAVASWLGNSGPWTTVDPQNLSASLGSQATGSPIAGALLALVLFLAILETLLARWFSHAYSQENAHPVSASGHTISAG